MKKLIKAGLVFGLLLLFAGNVWALKITDTDTIQLDRIDGNVGPYTMTNADTTNGTWSTYTSFCLELNEYFSPGTTIYNIDSVVDFAENGGIGGATNGKDYITDTTRWLYASFFDNTFYSLNLSIIDLGHMVQKAIWHEEDEANYLTEWTTLTTLAGGNFGTDGWDIKVVNLSQVVSGNTVLKQSQLVGAPVPEPATMVLFGIGLLGLAGIGRRRIQN